jgi:hypothetical protein
MSDESDTTGPESKTTDAATDPLKVEASEDPGKQGPAGSKRKVKTKSGMKWKKEKPKMLDNRQRNKNSTKPRTGNLARRPR